MLSATVSGTCLITFLAVARYVTLGNDSCNLFRNGVARQVAEILHSVKAPDDDGAGNENVISKHKFALL